MNSSGEAGSDKVVMPFTNMEKNGEVRLRPVGMGWHGVANVTPGQQDAIFCHPREFSCNFLLVFLSLYLCRQGEIS